MCFHWWPSGPCVCCSNDLSYQIMFTPSMSCSCNLNSLSSPCKYLKLWYQDSVHVWKYTLLYLKHKERLQTQLDAAQNAARCGTKAEATPNQHCVCLNTWSTHCNFSSLSCILVIISQNLTELSRKQTYCGLVRSLIWTKCQHSQEVDGHEKWQTYLFDPGALAGMFCI